MNQKLLPFNFNPPIKGDQGFAYPLSVLFADGNEYYPWFLNNFIQLIFKKDFSIFSFYKDSWWFMKDNVFMYYFVMFPSFMLSDNRDFICKYITYMIDNECYLTGEFNEYYIPNRSSYQKLNYEHECLVYGYDNFNQKYNLAGYTNRGFYEPTCVSYDEFYNSLKHIYTRNTLNLHFFKKSTTIKPKLDLIKIKTFLKDYIESKDSTKQYDEEYLYGIDACSYLLIYIETIHNHIDLRFFYNLLEHKKCMYNRINYLLGNHFIKNGSILYKYNNVVNLAQIILNMSIKFNITHKINILNNIKNQLMILLDNEKIILFDLVNMIIINK